MKLAVRHIAALSAALTLAATAGAANIYVLSSGDTATDSAVLSTLTSFGHTATLGVEYPAFDGSQLTNGFTSVYLQANYNWTALPMPSSGQQALITFVNGGGRLVTSEWVSYYAYAGGKFGELAIVLPLQQTFTYGTVLSTTFTQDTAEPAINAGLPASFGFTLTSYAGTEIYTTAKASAVTYYTSSAGSGTAGLAGWAVGLGRVYSFSTTNGPDQLADSNFARLLSNVFGSGGGGTCYANCDASTSTPVLNVADFTCFLQQFAAGCP